MAKGKRRGGLVPVREPSGKLLRSIETTIGAASPAEAKRLRDAALRGMADPVWGTELGRLFLAGKIGPILYEAGKRWSGLVEAYHRATGAPPPAPSSAAFFCQGGRRDADPESPEGLKQAERDESIVAAMKEAHAILASAGPSAERAVRSVCEYDRMLHGETDHRDFENGLSWLAQHWGLSANVKRTA